MNNNTSLVTL